MASRSARRRVVVIGGGVMGCAAAYQLSRAGLDVTLIERDGIAAHASGRNAGNLNPLHGTSPELIPYALEAFRLHRKIADELAQLGCAHCAPVPVQRVYLGYDEADRRTLEETAALFERTPGFSAVWLDDCDLLRMEPCLARDIRFGVLTEGNLTLDGSDFCRSLADGAIQLGARVRYETALGVATAGDRVTGIRTRQGLIDCDAAVLATGPWVADTESWFGIRLPVEPVKGQLLVMRLAGERPRYDLTWGTACLYRRGQNEVWAGVTVENCGFDCTPTMEAKQLLLDRSARILPDIRLACLLDHIAALRPMTASNLPIARRADRWENVYIANGGGSKGLLLSAGIAGRIRDLVLNQ